jgi:SHS2 domain-containing protein
LGYRLLDHVTDAIVEVTAPALEAAFLSAAESVVDITLDRETVRERERRQVAASGKDLDYLLLNWLEEVIYLLITEGFAVRRLDVRLSRSDAYRIDAVAHGEPIDLERHRFRVEIKAPTFHQMEIREGRTVTMRFLLDL